MEVKMIVGMRVRVDENVYDKGTFLGWWVFVRGAGVGLFYSMSVDRASMKCFCACLVLSAEGLSTFFGIVCSFCGVSRARVHLSALSTHIGLCVALNAVRACCRVVCRVGHRRVMCSTHVVWVGMVWAHISHRSVLNCGRDSRSLMCCAAMAGGSSGSMSCLADARLGAAAFTYGAVLPSQFSQARSACQLHFTFSQRVRAFGLVMERLL
jgi:hypothetical protein